ncbi:Ig-like domain-containing protein [Fulvivirga sediminis]|uniref:Cadherin-like domain-containing protein n=1 Tax=Fulvivirga sediminis TaxID=2803949 RepID=A0A937FE43_9BACT|nr:Ig-like domain-containing protein [Fulvivirga sediminis]MBL3658728.1 cadherin-like domain-containing protein [Fulvivirga sediminis]
MLVKNKLIWSIIVVLVFFGCDSFEEDVYPDKNQIDNTSDVVMSLSPGSPVVLDLLQSTQLTGNASISISVKPVRGTASITTTGLLKYIPNQDFISGADSLKYKACIDVDCDESKVEFRYSDDESTCVTHAVYDEANLTENSLIIDVLANDKNCDQTFDIASLKIEESPAHGTAKITDGIILYTVTDANMQTDQFIYGVSTVENPDLYKYGIVDIIKEEVILVEAKNDLFEYTFYEYITELEDWGGAWGSEKPLTFSLEQLLANDELFNIPASEFTVTMSNSMIGSGSYQNGVFSFTPSAQFNGSASFEYQICYGNKCSSATVSIAVPEYNDGQIQVINNVITFDTWEQFDQALVDNNSSLNLSINDILGNDDLEGIAYNQLFISVIKSPSFGEVIYYDLELFKYTPDSNFENSGVDSFDYQVCYGQECVEGTVTIKVGQ